jgi:hypothetical protein
MTDAPTGRPGTCACDGLTGLCCHACWQAGFETAADDAEQASETGQATFDEVVA